MSTLVLIASIIIIAWAVIKGLKLMFKLGIICFVVYVLMNLI